MKNFLEAPVFIISGLLTAAIGKWQLAVLVQGDLMAFLSALAFDTLYLGLVYLLCHLMLRWLQTRPRLVLAYAAVFGLVGLMVEWFVVNNSPWTNPGADQFGLFAQWACLSLVPLMGLLERRGVQTLIVRFGLFYVVLSLIGQLALPGTWRSSFHTYMVSIGYLALLALILVKFLRDKQATKEATP
ncbi:MAG: hypothetical protein A2087_06790 [Spirochaetes bacterium GWD1_61_31]|nr:MAG: hypothetical protein A2Y37_08680 [Spirochaetes bacterium GWB1_60_80]OHD31849.1 MAG: hypothetical protein A2004_10055 [Spirochaetes bacterium GWC1_61_12]OHD40055.1 MAG: hypothetical protein A2087_06790 [Spirochaetes bacterium GWD1_61_31]OHD45896.1 MAG: hypothetical protein A2Y35_04315 [Spirochaetes bacterium GWE1_60_18]OHD58440.1 MAG: hypothetical protein A2Y32_06705 [Spirochaetes bacterium GWF1_60_12]HAP44012.1 hypothetical protein [Spirochaetaceae bacterium]